jgi:hypothetical protein
VSHIEFYVKFVLNGAYARHLVREAVVSLRRHLGSFRPPRLSRPNDTIDTIDTIGRFHAIVKRVRGPQSSVNENLCTRPAPANRVAGPRPRPARAPPEEPEQLELLEDYDC